MSENPQESGVEPEVASQALRRWPAVLLLSLMALSWLIAAVTGPDQESVVLGLIIGRVLAGLLLVPWWLFASRATLKERLWGAVALVGIMGLTFGLLHPTMGFPGMMLIAMPVGLATFGLAALFCGAMRPPRRAMVILTVTACAFGATLLLRSGGMWSDGVLALQWRWAPSTEEQQLDNEAFDEAVAQSIPLDADASVNLRNPAWPEFRGPDRASRQTGVRLAPDWDANPPETVWRIPVGPAWSSFVVAGDLLFTQEQRGDREAVTCYNAQTGELHWISEVQSRFSDPLGGPGPRATPTLHNDSLYTMGGEGLLRCHDALTGALHWEVDLREEAGRTPPTWGFASSPLVVGEAVIVHAGGEGDRGVFAFHTATGERLWSSPSGNHAYSSPQRADIGGNPVVLVLTNTGLDILDPATGDLLLNYAWAHRDYRALQPQALGGGAFLLPSGTGTGTRRIQIAEEDGALTAEDLWTATDFRPDFNDMVVHDGFAYGFDGGRFVCFDLQTGERAWRGGRYGKGQVLLLADAAQLLVTTEKGEVVLLEANPERHIELTRFRAFDGKTWNHPVLVGDRLYLRNAEEAACFRLALG